MNRRPPAKSSSSAFTLIEVLLAVSVFAIVLAAINSVFFSALRLRNKTIESLESGLPLRHALGLIKKDFEGIMLPGGRLAGNFTTTLESGSNNVAFIGERLTPDIYTCSGNVSDLARWADVQKVAYFLALPTNNNSSATSGKDLVRSVTRNLLPVNVEEPEAQWLMSGVQTLKLQFYDGLTWAEAWDSATTTNLPRAVKVQLTLAGDIVGTRETPAPIELVIPIMVQGTNTNTTDQAEGGAE